MRAGTLRQRVRIQQRDGTVDAAGQPNDVWKDLILARASVEPLRGRELFVAQQTHSEVTHKVRLRWRKGIEPKMRLVVNDRAFDIHAVLNPLEANRELELHLSERPDA